MIQLYGYGLWVKTTTQNLLGAACPVEVFPGADHQTPATWRSPYHRRSTENCLRFDLETFGDLKISLRLFALLNRRDASLTWELARKPKMAHVADCQIAMKETYTSYTARDLFRYMMEAVGTRLLSFQHH